MGEKIIEIEASDVVTDSMFEYGVASMYRAIPSNIDGLKPVHRRILYSMWLKHTGNNHKCATIVGGALEFVETGDAGVYQSLVFMGQKDRHIYPLIESQGNFGSIISSLEEYAASRYTEAKLSKYAIDWYFTEDMKYTEWKDNYIQTTKEPVVLPTLLPLGLTNGGMGIALAANHRSFPIGLKDLAKSYLKFLDFKEKGIKSFTPKQIEDIYKLLKFKFVNNSKTVKFSDKLFHTGKGSITIAGEYHIEEGDYGRENLVITKLPYLKEVSKFIFKLKTLPKELKDGVVNLVDESSGEGIRIILTLKKGFPVEALTDYLTMTKGAFKSGGLVETNNCNYGYFSHKYKRVMNYSILELFEEHLEFKLGTLGKYFEDMIKQCEDKIEYLNAILYIVSDISRRELFFNTVSKSNRDDLGDNLHKKFKDIRKEVLLYVTERKFTVLLKGSEEIKEQLKTQKEKLAEYKKDNSNRIDYMRREITKKISKY